MNWKQALLAVAGFVLGILAVISVNSVNFDDLAALILAGVTLVSMGVLAAFGFVALWERLD